VDAHHPRGLRAPAPERGGLFELASMWKVKPAKMECFPCRQDVKTFSGTAQGHCVKLMAVFVPTAPFMRAAMAKGSWSEISVAAHSTACRGSAQE